jgi:hypothetical protein
MNNPFPLRTKDNLDSKVVNDAVKDPKLLVIRGSDPSHVFVVVRSEDGARGEYHVFVEVEASAAAAIARGSEKNAQENTQTMWRPIWQERAARAMPLSLETEQLRTLFAPTQTDPTP